ncbi:MAG TPA: lysophospholipid acyltransferase family protein [Ignavibacteria bacterium]|nr:lysophospholipid acyltransferase family protein [Ignavibacteria bacterium]HRJ99178.1 lysophospholipid acyltransferase family protein [Ignavibacteria bacterium]
MSGAVFFYLIPIRKKVAYSNLSLCFPDKDHSFKKSIVKENYINLGINLFEFFYLPKLNNKRLKDLTFFKNEYIAEESRKKGKGTLFLSGHYSNWELTAFSFSMLFGISLKIIAKPQGSEVLNRKINSYREMSGNEIIQTGYSLRAIFDKLENNDIVCFLIDQSAHPDYSVYINFLGQNTSAFSGPAKIALKKRPELILGYGVRNKNYKYEIFLSNINYEDINEYNPENIKLLTQRIQTEFEKIILKNPGQWLWLHKRFKHVR